MEFLSSIHENLKKIDERDIEYIDLFDYPELIYGNVNVNSGLNFCKFPRNVQDEMEKYGTGVLNEMKQFNSSSSGNRLRVKTDSKRIVFKIQLNRKYDFININNTNSFGFDVYNVINGQYIHENVFSPGDGNNIFAHEIEVPENGEICIFLPNYNSILSFFMGFEKGSSFETLKYPQGKRLPVLFYGNAVTQGASASRSGNSFTNILSRLLDRDMINVSCSSCCKATDNTADFLGKINCHAIVIDYTHNAYDTEEFMRTHERFYKKIRQYHPDTKIVLMTSENFNFWKSYDEYDEIVKNTYDNARIHGENVELINQRQLFDENEYDLVSVDDTHYSDYGMYIVAKKLCEIIGE